MTMKEKVYELLKDGYPHPRDEIVEYCGCRPGTLSFLLSMVRKSMLKGQEEIVCQYIERRLHYRIVLAINKKSNGLSTPPQSTKRRHRKA